MRRIAQETLSHLVSWNTPGQALASVSVAMASSAQPKDLESGSRDVDNYEMDGGANASEGLLGKPQQENPPEKKAGRASFFFWIAVNTLATIAIV